MNLKPSYTFDDVLLVPAYSEIKSRQVPDISSSFLRDKKFVIPFMPANMNTITEAEMINAFNQKKGTACLHRYFNVEEYIQEIKRVLKLHNNIFSLNFGISIGLKEKFNMPLFNEIFKQKIYEHISYIIIDVAHAHNIKVKETISFIKNHFAFSNVDIVAGNICTPTAAKQLYEWGADACKVGIGGGSTCITRKQCGIGFPQLSAIRNIKKFLKEENIPMKIIADGGIRYGGDAVKALAAGSDFLMMGQVFAGTDESPGEKLKLPDKRIVKKYEGMASCEARLKANKRKNYIAAEGIATFVDYKGSALPIIDSFANQIRTGLSYCGCKNLEELREYAENDDAWCLVTHAGQTESLPHVDMPF